MIEKIKSPDVICASWIGSYQYEMMMATNRIIDGLNEINKKLNGALCTCPEPTAVAHDCPIHK